MAGLGLVRLAELIQVFLLSFQGFPGGSGGRTHLSVQETRVRALGQEDLLQEGTAAHSGILAWRIPWKVGYSPWGHI